MKKEIPKLLKSASTVYAFDFFDTLFHAKSGSIISKIFGLKMLCNPHHLGIRWIIITSLPKIYTPIIKLYCMINGMNPIQIISSDKWFKKTKDSNEFVLNILMNIINGDLKLSYVKFEKIRRIRFISNNVELCHYINGKISRLHNDIISQGVLDFWEQRFECII